MLPCIVEWPSKEFYGGELINNLSTWTDKRPLTAVFSLFLPTAYGIQKTNRLMVETTPHRTKVGPNRLLTNYDNINLVESTVRQLTSSTRVGPSSISITSLYELQVLNYVHVLESMQMITPNLWPLLEGIEVAIVDSFQGKENEIVFPDLVTIG
jgi:superfamily I DNA and/or RNA helicase